jgi:hypothetical protein
MAGSRLIPRVIGLFKRACGRSQASLFSSSRKTANVEPDEEISSFIVHSSDIQLTTNSIRHTRLMPRPNKGTGRLETSICRSSGLSETEFWGICAKHFDMFSQKPAIGKGTAIAGTIYAEKLEFDPNGIPYPQHADIIGWHVSPGVPLEESKHFWMAKAQRMAPHFKFFPRPEAR